MNWTSRLAKATLFSLLVYNSTIFNPAVAFGPLSPEKQAHDIGVEAYEYAYPLVLLGLTRARALSGEEKSSSMSLNKFVHHRQFSQTGDHNVIRPNNDVLYSVAWVDVSKEPVVVSVPDTQERFYFLTMLDGWLEAFASPGKRVSGTQPGNFAIVGPRWKGAIPAGVSRLNSGTNYVWIVGRIEAKGQADIASVNTIQNGLKITPLSNYIKASGGAENSGENESAPANGAKSRESSSLECTTQAPSKQIADMSAERFFRNFAELLFSNPPHKEDAAFVAKLKLIGIEPGSEFHFDKLPAQTVASLESAVADAKAIIAERAKTIGVNENGWSVERKIAGSYGTNYLDRAAVSMIGAGLNRLDDAIYPSCTTDSQGQPLLGANRYVIHFDKSQLPPVKAFWSISLYDAQGFCIGNPLGRTSLSDHDDLKYGADGSLDIYVQHDDPGADKQANWLPAPNDEFNLLMRLYWPKTTVLSGAWMPPSVDKIGL
ncbi:MAG: DUF1254 domain-containing protein [Candidatus Obscuribacterales bacterium]|nr:DUF1254 domain-containing protein [Candidatus Obscuribacterales bacterium]